ncbi:MAG: hypothetical protein HY773_01075 [Candidatus Terrybacteria bacterium]|nr:hypothetical protein [Candidatus Terrybacteria bacterium]
MENIEPIREITPKGKIERKSEDEKFGWTDEEIKEVLEASPFYKDLSLKAIEDLVKRIQTMVKESEEREFKKAA